MRRGRAIRWGVAAISGVVALALLGVIGVRVFRPQDMLTRPTQPYPAAGPVVDERPFSELRAAPLILEGRLRVYAEKWRVWSDGPVGARYEGTPYWAYRRWPAQVIGVVAASSPAGPLVISQWSDGQLIALNARHGAISWRADAPVGAHSYTGRRTGATTVYSPASLFTAAGGTGRTVVVAAGPGQIRAFDAATGKALWSRTGSGDCTPAAWTSGPLLALPDCAGETLRILDAGTGKQVKLWHSPTSSSVIQPAGCQLGHSDCRLVLAGTHAFWISPNGSLVSEPGFVPGAMLAGAKANRVVIGSHDRVVVRPLSGGDPLWTWTGHGRLVAADASAVYVLTDDLTVVSLDPETGRVHRLGCAALTDRDHWEIGHVYTTGDGVYLAIERLSGASATGTDQEYYYSPRPMALVELYPPGELPIWSSEFAGCRPA